MPKLTYQIEHAPGKVYGTNSNELLFKEPSSHAIVYSTSTHSAGGILTSKKHTKQLFRGDPTSGVCIATLDEPTSPQHNTKSPAPLTMEMHPTTKLTLQAPKKSTSWLPYSSSWSSNGSGSVAFTFDGASYTWITSTRLKRDADGRTIARSTAPWFWQRGLGSLEVDVPEMGDEAERRGMLEVAVGTFVLRWWAGRVAEEERAHEAAEKKKREKRQRAEVEKEVAARKKAEQKQENAKKKEEAAKGKEEEAVEEGDEARRDQTASL